ncbi:MAG: rhomboid family intramembrane serine protease [Bacteroidetes bacterium]|nr:MAG: rhomboid family intramembrane serine protease [Bacteroidota bacterium]
MTYLISIITILVSLWAFKEPQIFQKLTFQPYLILREKRYYRFLSHALIHGSWGHLAFNMLAFLSFGILVEKYYRAVWGEEGIWYYLLLYVGGAVVSSIPSFIKHKEDPYYAAIGASGAISAVVFASILFDPLNKVYVMFIPIGIPAFIFGAVYLAISAYMAKHSKSNIGHDAHFTGALYGFLLTILLKPALFLRFITLISHH